jgi:hypothetical protein
LFDGQAHPSGGEDTAKVPMREERHISTEGAEMSNQTIDAFRYLSGRFSIWGAVTEKIPPRLRLANLRVRAAL